MSGTQPDRLEGTVVDVAVIGSGPAGAAAALGAVRARPDAHVALVDAAEFPRDKPCGDGVAPQVLDLLAEVGVTGLLDDRISVGTLQLVRGGVVAARTMRRPAYVVPRVVLDQRLREAALGAGAVSVRGRLRGLRDVPGEPVELDLGGRRLRARVVVGADGANSITRRLLGHGRGDVALALRGYAPVPASRRGRQVIVFGTSRQPSYAWSFDAGDGTANVGYGEVLVPGRPPPTRPQLLEWLEELLPGSTAGGTAWRAHHLPLSDARPLRPGRGRVLLTGDAAGLVNPLTGEGIHYAVATGLLAGRAAVAGPEGALAAYTRSSRRLLGRHLRHTAATARLSRHDRLLAAGLQAAHRRQAVFDDLVELGLARGTLTPRTAAALAVELARSRTRARVTR